MPTPVKAARGWLYNEATGERLTFQFNPEVQDRKRTQFERHRVPGLSHPVLQFVAGDARVITFRLALTALEGGRDILRDVRWLQSLQYPTWQEGVLKAAPPRVVLVMGPHLVVRGVVTGVEVQYQRWTPDLRRLLEATVQVDMEEYAPRSVNAADVLKGYIDPAARRALGQG